MNFCRSTEFHTQCTKYKFDFKVQLFLNSEHAGIGKTAALHNQVLVSCHDFTGRMNFSLCTNWKSVALAHDRLKAEVTSSRTHIILCT